MLQHTRKYIRFEMIYIFLFTFKTKYYRCFLLLFALFCVTSIFFPSFLAYEFVDVRFVTKKTESSNDDETVLSKITDLKIKYLWTVSLSETTKCRKDSQNHFFCFSFLFLLSSKKKRTRKGIDVTVYTVHEICAFEIFVYVLFAARMWLKRKNRICLNARVPCECKLCVGVCMWLQKFQFKWIFLCQSHNRFVCEWSNEMCNHSSCARDKSIAKRNRIKSTRRMRCTYVWWSTMNGRKWSGRWRERFCAWKWTKCTHIDENFGNHHIFFASINIEEFDALSLFSAIPSSHQFSLYIFHFNTLGFARALFALFLHFLLFFTFSVSFGFYLVVCRVSFPTSLSSWRRLRAKKKKTWWNTNLFFIFLSLALLLSLSACPFQT